MKIYIKDKKFIGSTIALFFGLVNMLGMITNPSPNLNPVMGGGALPSFYIIIGALVYRSAKKRKLNLVANTRKRKVFEFLALAFIVFVFLSSQQVLQMIQDGNITNLVIMAWIIIAYLTAIRSGLKKKVE